MALGAVQAITALGITPSYATPAATENLPGGRDLVLHVKNSGGSAGTVTPQDPNQTAVGNAAQNTAITIPATTGEKLIFLPAALTNPSTGFISVTFASGTLTGAVYYGL